MSAVRPESIRDMLARLFADPSVEIVYAQDDEQGWVDESGRPVEVPPITEHRNVTPLVYEGRRVGALICDPTVCRNPGIDVSLGAVIALALENERLRDELLVRLRELEERDEHHRALLKAMPDLLFRFDRNGTYLEAVWNEGRPDVLAEDAESLLGQSISDLLPRDIVERFLELVERVLADQSPEMFEYDLVIKGVEQIFEARIVPSGPDEVLAVVRNVTDRKRAERELRASRARIVEAADEQRRRIERDLHDGVQQTLLSARLALRLARERMREVAADEAETLMAEAEESVARAADELRALAHGIHPVVLTDEGIVAALRVLAGRAPIDVELDLRFDGRVALPVEAALYFVAAEALTNVIKHSGAPSARIALVREDGEARLEVVDEGRGGADERAGSGVRGLRDRVEALGGTLVVETGERGGTRIGARIPCE